MKLKLTFFWNINTLFQIFCDTSFFLYFYLHIITDDQVIIYSLKGYHFKPNGYIICYLFIENKRKMQLSNFQDLFACAILKTFFKSYNLKILLDLNFI
jgi:hypothetical protein